ncbi:MAG: thioredoxin domain-containing protein [Chloroflexi bacterium]|nr:thioredoxin domain-containing protein [Chloroflexota bacterium]MBI3731936.1 thioredoxin domain-containing protein [Chloroflexota bacterium]
MHQIAPQYLDNGKVKVIYRHFAFIGPESEWAAQAADCAGEQGKFWAYGDYLFKHQAGENNGAFSRDNLKKFAGALALDTAAFSACLDSGKYTAAMQKDMAEGRQRGVNATPWVFIGGQRLENILDVPKLTARLDALQPR